LGGVALASWWLFPLAEEATKVPALMGAIESLKAQGLTGLVVVCTFIQHQILPLRKRAHPLWQQQEVIDLMMEFPYPISEGATLGVDDQGSRRELPGVGVRPPPSAPNIPSHMPTIHRDGVGAPCSPF
jgi:hypothetical protein